MSSPAASRAAGGRVAQLVDEAEHTRHRGRMDVVVARRVVEADVAPDDREPERLARFAHALDDFGELPHHFGVLGIAEVEAVHERDGTGAGARDVARRFEHCEAAAGARIETAETRLAVGRHRERLLRSLHAQHGRVGAGTRHRVQEQLVVVLARHPGLVGDRRRGEQREQLAGEVGARGELVAQLRRGVGGLQRVLRGGARQRAVIQRTVAETLDGHVGDRRRVGGDRSGLVTDRRRRVLARHADRVEQAVVDAKARGVGDAPDDRRSDLPPLRQREHRVEHSRARRSRACVPGSPTSAPRPRSSPARAWRCARRRHPYPRRPWPPSPTPRTKAPPRRDPARRPQAWRRAVRGTPR